MSVASHLVQSFKIAAIPAAGSARKSSVQLVGKTKDGSNHCFAVSRIRSATSKSRNLCSTAATSRRIFRAGEHKIEVVCIAMSSYRRNSLAVWRSLTSSGRRSLLISRFAGHSARLACSAKPELHVCKAVCSATLQCVHQTCRGRCSDCQAVRRRGGESGHIDHPHEKVRACGHLCTGSCFKHVKEGQCPGRCRAPCSRACGHGSCAAAVNSHDCSQPCPSCLQACDTSGCPLPCASPCTPLPKDITCSGSLPCGCRCPSLEGEPCAGQICPNHAPHREQTVDFICMTTLGDFNPDDPDPLGRLITIDCGHAITAETLDGRSPFYPIILGEALQWRLTAPPPPPSGLFELKDFFAKSEEGSWSAPKVPQESRAPVTCPTCKTVITSASNVRYRRAIKFAELHHQVRSFQIFSGPSRCDSRTPRHSTGASAYPPKPGGTGLP